MGSVKELTFRAGRINILNKPGGLEGPCAVWGWEGAHILCDVSLVPISKLQGIALGVSHVPPVGQEAQQGKSRVTSPIRPCPSPAFAHSYLHITHLLQHSGQGLCLQVELSVKALVRSWDEGLLRGVGWASPREEERSRSGRGSSDSPVDLV